MMDPHGSSSRRRLRRRAACAILLVTFFASQSSTAARRVLSLDPDVDAGGTKGAPQGRSFLPDLPPWAKKGTGGSARVFSRHYLTLQGGFKTLNPFLTDEDLENVVVGEDCKDRSFYERCGDTPSLFSGLGLSKDGNFIGIGDRGQIAVQDCKRMTLDFKAGNLSADELTPNFDTGKGFVAPKASPVFAEMSLSFKSLDTVMDSQIDLRKSCYLRRADGSPASGLPNTQEDATPRDFGCQNTIDYDQGGIDSEAISVIPGSDLCIGSDEFGPSLFVFHCNFDDPETCGKIEVRYVPEGLSLPDAGYTVKDTLPGDLRNRRSYRGIHGVSVSPDGKTAYSIMRVPLGEKKEAPDALVTHAIKLDLTDPLDAKVSARYLYTLEHPDEWEPELGILAKDIKLHSSFWAAEETNACPERPLLLVMEQVAKKQIKMFLVDFSDATDVTGHKLIGDLGFEKNDKSLEKLGIKPAKKTLAFDTAQAEGWGSILSQDSAIIYPKSNGCVVAIGDDSFDGSGTPGITLVHLGRCIPEVYEASGGPSCDANLEEERGEADSSAEEGDEEDDGGDNLCNGLEKKMCKKNDDCTWDKHNDACLGIPGKELEEEEESEEGEAEEAPAKKEFYVKLENMKCFTGEEWTKPNGQASHVVSGVKSLKDCEDECTRFKNQGGKCVAASYSIKEKECRLYRECNLKKSSIYVTVRRLTLDSANEVTTFRMLT